MMVPSEATFIKCALSVFNPPMKCCISISSRILWGGPEVAICMNLDHTALSDTSCCLNVSSWMRSSITLVREKE
jgi:hypothetical protein